MTFVATPPLPLPLWQPISRSAVCLHCCFSDSCCWSLSTDIMSSCQPSFMQSVAAELSCRSVEPVETISTRGSEPGPTRPDPNPSAPGAVNPARPDPTRPCEPDLTRPYPTQPISTRGSEPDPTLTSPLVLQQFNNSSMEAVSILIPSRCADTDTDVVNTATGAFLLQNFLARLKVLTSLFVVGSLSACLSVSLVGFLSLHRRCCWTAVVPLTHCFPSGSTRRVCVG